MSPDEVGEPANLATSLFFLTPFWSDTMSKDYTVEVLFRFYVPVEDAESVDEAIAVATDEATLGEMLVGAKPIVGEISEGIA